MFPVLRLVNEPATLGGIVRGLLTAHRTHCPQKPYFVHCNPHSLTSPQPSSERGPCFGAGAPTEPSTASAWTSGSRHQRDAVACRTGTVPPVFSKRQAGPCPFNLANSGFHHRATFPPIRGLHDPAPVPLNARRCVGVAYAFVTVNYSRRRPGEVARARRLRRPGFGLARD
jgi:hypothetical protein